MSWFFCGETYKIRNICEQHFIEHKILYFFYSRIQYVVVVNGSVSRIPKFFTFKLIFEMDGFS
jgi:hypothetical protein